MLESTKKGYYEKRKTSSYPFAQKYNMNEIANFIPNLLTYLTYLTSQIIQGYNAEVKFSGKKVSINDADKTNEAFA